MTRIVDVESLPTRTKTNPAYAAKRGMQHNKIDTASKSKWPKRATIKHEKIGQFLYEMAA